MKHLYHFFCIITLAFFTNLSYGQNVGIGTNNPHSSAKLHIEDANRGILIPRVNLTALNTSNPVNSPADGLLLYNTNSAIGNGAGFYYWSASNASWMPLDNDNQTITQASLNGNNLNIALENGNAATVDLSPLNTDNQMLSSTGLDASNVVRIAIQNGNYIDVNLSALANSGSDDQNLTTATLDANNVLTIGIEGGNSTAVNLSALAYAGTDDQNLTSATFNSNNNVLTIGIEGGNSVSVNLSALNSSGTDDQNLTLNGTNLSIENGNSVNLSSIQDGTGTDDQNLTTATFGNNILTIGIENGNSTSVNLSALDNTANAWNINGNGGTSSTNQFIGTSDNQDLVFRTNNVENMRINTGGNVGIGTSSSLARLYVDLPNTNTNTNYGIYNVMDGAAASTAYGIRNNNFSSSNSAKYGIYNDVNSEGTGARYGIRNEVDMNASSIANGYGSYNYLQSFGRGSHYANYNWLVVNGTTDFSDHNYGSYNRIYVSANAYSGDVYGEFTEVDFSSGTRYGEYKYMNSHDSYDGTIYSDYNRIYGDGDGVHYGNFNSLESTGSGTQYAVYNDISGAGSGPKYGVRNQFSDIGGTKYGVYNLFENGTSSGTIYGSYNRIQNDGPSSKYGTRNYIGGGEGGLHGTYNEIYPSSSNSSTIYGTYNYVSSTGTGVHYAGYFSAYGDGNRAVYGSNSHASGYAGYFNGNGYWNGDMVFNDAGASNHDFRIESDTREYAMWLDSDEDLIRFGTSSTYSDGSNGSTIDGVTVSYVADFDIGNAEGTAIGIGSVEFLLDGSSKTTINNVFAPSTDNIRDLGTSSLRWDDVYATNGTIVTSDKREKEAVNALPYGLNEIMQLRPVTFKWNKQAIGKTPLEDAQKEVKLGLIAQEVQQVLPEVVQTHNWEPISEDRPGEFHLVPMERLGMSYHEMIPVLIKGMQEQQQMIEAQNKRIEQLEKLLLENTKE